MKKLLLIAALASLASFAQAESNLVSPVPANAVATARVDFKITVPRVLYLRVGTGTDFVNNIVVDPIDFAVPAATIGNGTAVAAIGGDLTGGAVTVRVLGNGGDVKLVANTTGAMNTGTPGQTIGWNQISVATAPLAAPTANFNNVGITHPAFPASDTGPGVATTLASTNNVVRQEGKWTYSYLNANVVPAGVYGGVNTNNGRVSYTATMP